MRLALLAAVLMLALAGAARAGHTGTGVPEGTIVVRVLFVQVDSWIPSPLPETDALYAALCGATSGLPASCAYIPPACVRDTMGIFCGPILQPPI